MVGDGGRRLDYHKPREGAASKVPGRRLSYAVGKIAYGGRLGTQGTDTARRGDIGEDAKDKRPPATGKFPKSAKKDETAEIPDSSGVWGQEEPAGMLAIDLHRPPDFGCTTTNS